MNPENALLVLRGMTVALRQEARHNIMAGMAPEDAVELGAELWRLIEEAKGAADIIRDVLRDAAGDVPGHVKLEGREGSTVSVHVPKPRPVLRKGHEIRDLVAVLGPADFDRLFTSKLHFQPRPGGVFENEVMHLSGEKRAAVLDAFDTQTPPARVSYPK